MIFHSYVKLPEGNFPGHWIYSKPPTMRLSKFYLEKKRWEWSRSAVAGAFWNHGRVICNGKTLVCLVCLYRPKHLFLLWSWYETSFFKVELSAQPSLFVKSVSIVAAMLAVSTAHGCCLMWSCNKWIGTAGRPYKEYRDLLLDFMKRHSKSHTFSGNYTEPVFEIPMIFECNNCPQLCPVRAHFPKTLILVQM